MKPIRIVKIIVLPKLIQAEYYDKDNWTIRQYYEILTPLGLVHLPFTLDYRSHA